MKEKSHPSAIGKALAIIFGGGGILIGAYLLFLAYVAISRGNWSGPGGAISALFGAIILLCAGGITVRNVTRSKQ